MRGHNNNYNRVLIPSAYLFLSGIFSFDLFKCGSTVPETVIVAFTSVNDISLYEAFKWLHQNNTILQLLWVPGAGQESVPLTPNLEGVVMFSHGLMGQGEGHAESCNAICEHVVQLLCMSGRERLL